jgi:hypothetical protein
MKRYFAQDRSSLISLIELQGAVTGKSICDRVSFSYSST